MTKYEQLKSKADACRRAGSRTSGTMRSVWLDKAKTLERRLSKMTMLEAQEVIE